MTAHPPASGPVNAGESGFTLIELMISLALFGLIAAAGLAMVDGVLRVQGRTEARLDRLAELQRTMFVVSSDLDQISQGKIAGQGGELSFTRAAPGAGGPPVEVHYLSTGGALVRQAAVLPQPLLTGVNGVRWRFFDQGLWTDRWPMTEEDAERWPRAVELSIDAREGALRRIVVLPVQAVSK